MGSFIEMHRRDRRSWQAIVARMSPECKLAWREWEPDRLNTVTEEWAKMPWTAFRDAGVLMEMAEYAERNAPGLDSTSIQDFRATALELRFAAAGAMIGRISFR